MQINLLIIICVKFIIASKPIFQNNCPECCDIFIKFCNRAAGVANQPDFSGKSPVHFAAAAGHSEIIQKLTLVPACDLEVEDPEER